MVDVTTVDVTAPARAVPAPGGGLDVVYVLTLMQVAFLLLGAAGEVVMMGGNPAYLVLPALKSVLLLLFATHALRRRRWALRALVVLAWITLAGVALQLLIGLAPGVDFTLNLVGLMTNVGVPVAVIVLCRPHLRAIREARRAAAAMSAIAAAAAAGQPYPGAPLVYPLPTAYGGQEGPR